MKPLRLVGLALIALTLLSACWEYRPPTPPRIPPPPRSEIRIIRTNNPNFYYLVDTRRRLCFFARRHGYGPMPTTQVDCRSIPEAAALLGPSATAPQATLPSLQTTPATPPPPGSQPPTPQSTVPPAPGSEDKASSTTTDPATETTPTEPPPPTAPITDAERQQFRQAYQQIFCQSLKPPEDPKSAAQIAQQHQLTEERYQEILRTYAQDAEQWKALTADVLKSCR